MKIQTLAIAVITLGIAPIPPVNADSIFDGSQRLSGVKIIEDPTDASNEVAHWSNAAEGVRFPVARETLDLSDADAISLRFFSDAADGRTITILLNSNPEGQEGNYYLGTFTVDWDGWNTVVIPFSEFQISRQPVGWNQIDEILLANVGYGGTDPSPDALYYVDDFEAISQ